jgi:hypothetical protein
MKLGKILATCIMESMVALWSTLNRDLKCDVPSPAISSKEVASEQSLRCIDQMVFLTFLPLAK